MDRQEKARGERSALGAIEDAFGVPTYAIVSLNEIVARLSRAPVNGTWLLNEASTAAIAAYRARYGVG